MSGSGAGDAVLEVRGLSVAFGAREVVRGVDFDVPARGITAIVGPSGAGKSTLLRALNRLLDLVPDARVGGRVRFCGTDVYAPGVDPDRIRERIGMVFQQPVVFPTTIRRNGLFALRHLGRLRRGEADRALRSVLERAGLWEEVADRLDAPARELSVGQQQRLALARTLTLDPELLLLDEPTSALDRDSVAAVERTLCAFAAERPILLVTHDREQVRRLAAEVLALEDGRLVPPA